MSKIKSLQELQALREQLKGNLNVRASGENEENIRVVVGMATCGIAAGARQTLAALIEEAKKQQIENVTFIHSGCMGSCYAEPTVEVRVPGKEAILYGNVNPEKAKEIVIQHLKNGELVQNLIIAKPFETI